MNLLFHQDLVVAPLGSGSRGNATYIGDGITGVLVDCGLSARQIQHRMDLLGLRDAPIDAVLVTHEHSDHCASAAILERLSERGGGPDLPFYMTVGTAQGMPSRCRPHAVRPILAGAPFMVGGLRIEPLSVPHDTIDPVCFTVASGSTRVGVFTDLGSYNRLLIRQLASVDIAILEFNHDVDMLLAGPHPWPIKQRVQSDHGHLSNEQAGHMLREASVTSSRLKHLVLAHLSQDNNTPDLAFSTAEQALFEAGRVGVEIAIAPQDEPAAPIRISRRGHYDRPKPSETPSVPGSQAEVIPLFPVSSIR